jgi:hypothetical protein
MNMRLHVVVRTLAICLAGLLALAAGLLCVSQFRAGLIDARVRSNAFALSAVRCCSTEGREIGQMIEVERLALFRVFLIAVSVVAVLLLLF